MPTRVLVNHIQCPNIYGREYCGSNLTSEHHTEERCQAMIAALWLKKPLDDAGPRDRYRFFCPLWTPLTAWKCELAWPGYKDARQKPQGHTYFRDAWAHHEGHISRGHSFKPINIDYFEFPEVPPQDSSMPRQSYSAQPGGGNTGGYGYSYNANPGGGNYPSNGGGGYYGRPSLKTTKIAINGGAKTTPVANRAGTQESNSKLQAGKDPAKASEHRTAVVARGSGSSAPTRPMNTRPMKPTSKENARVHGVQGGKVVKPGTTDPPKLPKSLRTGVTPSRGAAGVGKKWLASLIPKTLPMGA